MSTNGTTSPGNTAALVPPLGVESDFSAPNPLQDAVIATMTVCLFFSTTLTLVRVYAQFHIFSALTWADLWVVVAWGAHVAFDSMLLAILPLGAGHHQWDVTLDNYYHLEFLLYVSFILYDPAITCAKISILLQLSRMFTGSFRSAVWWAIQILIWLNVLFYFPITIALIFSCTPREKIWNPTVPGFCVNQNVLLTSTGPANVVSDFLMFFLPVWAIWHLQIPIKKKLNVSTAFTMGLFGCTCSAVRLVYSSRLSHSGDGTYIIMQNQMWANAEITLGIVIANIIVFPRFFRTLRKGSKGTTRAGSTNPITRSLKDRKTSRPSEIESFPSRERYIELDSVHTPPANDTSVSVEQHSQKDQDETCRREQGIEVTETVDVTTMPRENHSSELQ